MRAAVAALLPPLAAAAPPLPCGDSGLPFTPCPAAWEQVGPATYKYPPKGARRGRDGAEGGGDDDERRGPRRVDDDEDDADDQYGFEDAAAVATGRADAETLAASSATQWAVEGRSGVWFAGTVNGGVWRCRDIYAATPHWEPLLDSQPVRCSSIAALAVSPLDPDRVLAGCGSPSSGEMGKDWQTMNNGDWGGVMESRDGGDTWAMLEAFPANYYVTGFAFPAPGHVAVSAFSHFFNATDGGMWLSNDDGRSFARTLRRQIFDLRYDMKTATMIAAAANDAASSVWSSADGGATWDDWSTGVAWSKGHLPFYACLAVSSDGVAFVGLLTRDQADIGQTASVVFSRKIGGGGGWAQIANNFKQKNLDQDHMPKDRMGLLADPGDPSVLYVLGNAASVAWRVDWARSDWVDLTSDGDSGGTSPHSDCRNYAWEPQRGNLILVSDGGLFLRTQPRRPGGRWMSIGGDITAMEFVSAAWDSRLSRWVAGAQDNGAQLAPPNATAAKQALGIVSGDGTLTEVDNRHRPSRVWASAGGAGSVGALGGIGFFEGDGAGAVAVSLPVADWFPDGRAFCYFVHPWTINTQEPSRLVFWANGTAANGSSAWWGVDVPDAARAAGDVPAPTRLAESGGEVFSFVAGGFTDGRSDPSVLVGVNDTTLFYRSAATAGRVERRALPMAIAPPVGMITWSNGGADFRLGPVSHGKTASVAVLPSDSRVIAVTGWPSLATNDVKEGVWLSRDAGASWEDAFGDLAASCATVARARPEGLLLVDFSAEVNASALLVGTVSGAFVSWTDNVGKWARLGRCTDLPVVLTMGLQYEHYSDTLIAATYGRGAYALRGARRAILRSRAQQARGSCAAAAAEDVVPSTRFFPAQL